ncbi:MAG: alkaline phosphatase family protein [Theionarchaea archaeon]|nr:alkaline phosphatase family protein [Theionarchaea archaeon]
MKPLFICVVLLFVLAPVQYEFGHADQIILVVLDGADPSVFSLEGFPLYGECEAVFPPMTSPGHVSLLTGVYPNRHGILANEYIEDKKTKNYIPPMIEVPTLFDLLKENGKKGIFISGKKGLAAFVGGRANLTVSPVVYPVYLSTPPEDPYELTRWIFDAITEIDKREHPDFLCVNVPILDELGHTYGPESKETKEAVKVVQDLVYSLRDSLDENTTLIVTADHGMSPVSKAVPIHVLLRNEQYEAWPLHVGRSAYLYDMEEGVEEFILTLKGVKEVIEPKDYPQYHIDHENAPHLIVLAEKDYLFIPEPLLENYKGMHGSPDERDTLVYMAGKGIPEGYTECYQVDIAPLVCYMLDLNSGVVFDGSIPVIKEKKPEEAHGFVVLVLAGILLYLMISRGS